MTAEQRLTRLRQAIEDQDVDAVVCPELFMGGYNVGDKSLELAEPVDGPFGEKIAAMARATRTAVVYGYPERDGDQCFNSAACVDETGSIIANHRKLLLPPGFETGLFEQGSGLTVFELNGVTCAILICYDAEFPETVRAACLAGAQMVFVPTALSENWPSVAHQLMPTRAFENGTWLLYANHAGSENGLNYLGASCIVAPDGSDAARAGKDEQLLSAEIDVAQVSKARQRLPYLKEVPKVPGFSQR